MQKTIYVSQTTASYSLIRNSTAKISCLGVYFDFAFRQLYIKTVQSAKTLSAKMRKPDVGYSLEKDINNIDRTVLFRLRSCNESWENRERKSRRRISSEAHVMNIRRTKLETMVHATAWDSFANVHRKFAFKVKYKLQIMHTTVRFKNGFRCSIFPASERPYPSTFIGFWNSWQCNISSHPALKKKKEKELFISIIYSTAAHPAAWRKQVTVARGLDSNKTVQLRLGWLLLILKHYCYCVCCWLELVVIKWSYRPLPADDRLSKNNC